MNIKLHNYLKSLKGNYFFGSIVNYEIKIKPVEIVGWYRDSVTWFLRFPTGDPNISFSLFDDADLKAIYFVGESEQEVLDKIEESVKRRNTTLRFKIKRWRKMVERRKE